MDDTEEISDSIHGARCILLGVVMRNEHFWFIIIHFETFPHSENYKSQIMFLAAKAAPISRNVRKSVSQLVS